MLSNDRFSLLSWLANLTNKRKLSVLGKLNNVVVLTSRLQTEQGNINHCKTPVHEFSLETHTGTLNYCFSTGASLWSTKGKGNNNREKGVMEKGEFVALMACSGTAELVRG
jgi:hypothetical protein